jgi:hypothetical protein
MFILTQPAGELVGLPQPHGPSFTLTYSLPIRMSVGDVADVREHLRNDHITTETATGAPSSAQVDYELSTQHNCTVTRNVPGEHHIFPARGNTAAYAWTLTADHPGQCILTFKTTLPDIGVTQISTATVRVYERFTPAEETAIIVAVIGAVGLVVAAVASAYGLLNAGKPPPSAPTIIRP